MPQPNQIKLYTADNTEFVLTPLGRQYSEASELITREDRSANGTLRRDVIAEKKTLTLSYDIIDNVDLLMLEDLLTNHADETLRFEVKRLNGLGTQEITKQYNVMIRPFSRQRLPMALWEGVSVEFVEV